MAAEEHGCWRNDKFELTLAISCSSDVPWLCAISDGRLLERVAAQPFMLLWIETVLTCKSQIFRTTFSAFREFRSLIALQSWWHWPVVSVFCNQVAPVRRLMVQVALVCAVLLCFTIVGDAGLHN